MPGDKAIPDDKVQSELPETTPPPNREAPTARPPRRSPRPPEVTPPEEDRPSGRYSLVFGRSKK